MREDTELDNVVTFEMRCVCRLQNKSVEMEVSWARSSVCPSQQFTIEASGFRTVSFYTRPQAISCGESSVKARLWAATCSANNITSNIHSLYVNTEAEDQCSITMN